MFAPDPPPSQLDAMVDVATDPGRYEPDLALCLEICDLVNQKGGKWPRDAAIAIVRRINSPNQQQALLALSLLDICVKNCGYPFHLQVASKEFLNELVRRFPANPPQSLNPIQWKILEFIGQWNATLVEHSRYKADLKHIRDMHKLLCFKGYRFPNFNAEAAAGLQEAQVLKTEQEMEEEDRKAQEAKLHELIRRGTPADLAQANDLMKTLTGYDLDRRPDYRKKLDEELDRIAQKAQSLLDIVSTSPPSSKPATATQELYAACKSAWGRVQKMVTEAEPEDERLSKLLDLNDLLVSAVEAYEDLRGGRPVNLPSNPSQAGITSRPSEVVAPRKEEGSLIQFDAEEEVPTADEVLAGRAGSASGAASPTNLLDDLAGLSFSDASRPWGLGGGIALQSSPAKPASTTPSTRDGNGLDLFEFGTDKRIAYANAAGGAMATASPTGPVSAAPAPDPFDILDFGSPSSSGPAISSSTQPNESRTAKEVSLFDKNGFTARISRVGAVDGGTEYRISYYNAIPVPMENLVFQAAVPKTMSVKLFPPSATVIPGNNKEPITQKMALVNTSSEAPKLRFRVSYTIGGGPVVEQGVLEEFETL